MADMLDDPALAAAERQLEAEAESKKPQTQTARKRSGSSTRSSVTPVVTPVTAASTQKGAVATATASTPAPTATSTGRAVMADYRSIATSLRATKAADKEEAKDLSLVAADVLAQLAKLDPKAHAKLVEKADSESSDDKSEAKKAKKDKSVKDEYFDGAPVPGQSGFVYFLKKGKADDSQDRSDYRIGRESDWTAEKDKPAKSAGLKAMLLGNSAGGN
jgi:hypothetical protein